MDKHRQIETEENGVTELTIRGAHKQKNLLEWSRRVAECRGSGVSVSRWCAEHGVNRKTYYTWQKKVFAVMIEQQKLQMMETAEPESRFVELPSPPERNEPVATVRVGMASLELYGGASTEFAAALCTALIHAK